MRLDWSDEALDDLARLHDFLAPAAPDAAARAVQGLVDAAEGLLQNPKLWERLDLYWPREVRAVILLNGRYELRYEVTEAAVTVLRIWSTREDR
jgi:plasmid stabilization system protein ParE